MEADNERRVRAAYQAWNDTKGGSIDTWLALFAEEGAFASAAGGRPGVEFSAPAHDRAGLRHYLETLMADWEMVYARADDVIVQGDKMAVRGAVSFRNRASGKVFESVKVDLWRFEKGVAVDFYESLDTAALMSALP